MASEILTEIFLQKESNYNLGSRTALQVRNIKTVMYSTENIFSLGPKIWDILPMGLKEKLCLLYYSKRKFVNGHQRIIHVVYVKRAYIILYFFKLPGRTHCVLYVDIFYI